MEYARNHNFTKEELEYFEKMIEESREMQRQNGNKTYTEDEVMENLEKMDKKMEKRLKEMRENGRQIPNNPEKARIMIENLTEEIFMEMLQEEESDYNRN